MRRLQHRLKDEPSSRLERRFARPVRVEERLEDLNVAVRERTPVYDSTEAPDEGLAALRHGVGARHVRCELRVPCDLFGDLCREELVSVRSSTRRKQGGTVVAEVAAPCRLIVGKQGSGLGCREVHAKELVHRMEILILGESPARSRREDERACVPRRIGAGIGRGLCR